MQSDETMEMPSEETQVRRRVSKARLRDETQQEYLRRVLSTVEGRAVLWEVLGLANIYASGMSIDPHHMAYQCGRRDVGLRLLQQIKLADRGAYALMENESVERNND